VHIEKDGRLPIELPRDVLSDQHAENCPQAPVVLEMRYVVIVDELALPMVLVFGRVERVHAHQCVEAEANFEPSPGHEVRILDVNTLV
jgi:hypothetical protein